MRRIVYIIEKEFKQIFRNKVMLPIIFVLPMVQLLILSYAIDYEVRNINVFIEDNDNSSISKELINKFMASGFISDVYFGTEEEAQRLIEKNDIDLIINIEQGFENDLIQGNKSNISITADAINGMKAGVVLNYSQQIINQYIAEFFNSKLPELKPKGIIPYTAFWYNPNNNYKLFMVPGILVLLVTMIGLFLSAMNIVREKEIGTIEQLNVTPIKKHEFIIGKLFPLLILGIVEFSIGLLIANLWFNISVEGSLIILYIFTVIYLSLVLGIGMLISTFSDTQQQAMFIAWFFAVIFILMSGFFTPVESMPDWARFLTNFNPIKHYIEVLRLVILKGSGVADLYRQFITILVFSAVINYLAVRNYSKTSN